MNFKRFLGKVFSGIKIIKSEIQPSFSQSGEDQVIRYLMYNILQIAKPTYLDIGTNHPYKCNNTFYFYNRGSRGVCIEPDQQFAPLIKKYRSGDVFLQAGVSAGTASEAIMYTFPGEHSGWNTFSAEEAIYRHNTSGVPFTKTHNVEQVNINEVIEKYFNPHPNIISLDVEGLDLDILKSLDFTRFQPEVICVETITFSVTNEEEKIVEIFDLLTAKGYMVFADTHVNTIFCRANLLKKNN
jgi:FkbM family methyltransferase